MSAGLILPLLALLLADNRRRNAGVTPTVPVNRRPVRHAHHHPHKPPPPTVRPQHPAAAVRPPAAHPVDPGLNTQAPMASPPAWPSAVPADLPPFPGGWMPHPQPGRVAQRAVALLPVLWRQGEGQHMTEQTAGEWVTYQSKMMGTKRGVIAWVPRTTAPQPQRPAAPVVIPQGQEPMAPIPVPVTHPAHVEPVAAPEFERPNMSHETSPAQVIPASVISPAPPAGRARPQLRRGSSGPDVAYLQSRLKIFADGKFGPGTEKSVKAFQGGHGLAADGIVGPRTWAALEAA